MSDAPGTPEASVRTVVGMVKAVLVRWMAAMAKERCCSTPRAVSCFTRGRLLFHTVTLVPVRSVSQSRTTRLHAMPIAHLASKLYRTAPMSLPPLIYFF